jgi:hypothetical protein
VVYHILSSMRDFETITAEGEKEEARETNAENGRRAGRGGAGGGEQSNSKNTAWGETKLS